MAETMVIRLFMFLYDSSMRSVHYTRLVADYRVYAGNCSFALAEEMRSRGGRCPLPCVAV